MNVSGLHLVLQQIALRINEQVALAALDLLAPIVPTWSTHLGGLHALAVDDRRCGLRSPANPTAVALAQRLGHVLPGAVLAPLRIVIENGAARGILVRQQPPLRSSAQ